jgi:RNA polymerase sigma-70 factor (ECF subfamily)
VILVVHEADAASDLELHSGVCNGNATSFAALYDRYGSLVYGIGRRMLGDAAEAEDVVQSVFLALWLTPERFRGGAFGAWVTSVTRNRVRDVLRKRTARRESPWPEQLVEQTSLEEIVHSNFEDRRVRTALAALPETQRTLIELGFYGDRSHAELAELMRLPLGTVKTRMRAGLQRRRDSLAPFQEGPPPGAFDLTG